MTEGEKRGHRDEHADRDNTTSLTDTQEENHFLLSQISEIVRIFKVFYVDLGW